MKRYLITSAFCKATLLEQCLDHIYQNPPKDMVHVIIDDHYPINREENLEITKKVVKKYDCVYIDCEKNRGLHEAINFSLSKLPMSPQDVIVLCDADDRPSVGALDTLVDVIKTDRTLAVCGMMFNKIRSNFSKFKYEERRVANHRVWIHPGVDMWNIASYRYDFIQSIGGYNEIYPFYGGLEAYLHSKWLQKRMQLGYLADFISDAIPVDESDRRYFDSEYRQWKNLHITGDKRSFEQWLNFNSLCS